MTDKIVKPGELWQLGDHRLYCGDARELPAELFKDMGGVRMILADPPYGVGYAAKNEMLNKLDNGNRIEEDIVRDEKQTEEEFANFSKEWLDKAKEHLDQYNVVYIFISDLTLCALKQGMKQAGFYYSQMIIWIKNNVVIGRKDYLPQHELIAYGWHGRHKLERGKDRSVLFFPKPNKAKLHPTMKPVGLLRKLILNSTKINEVVLDPFGGSGSTLIACEHTKRKCLMSEVDPLYCSTIIKRWEKLIDKEAIKL